MPTALLYAIQVLTAAPALITGFQNVKDMLADAATKLQAMVDEKRDPTPAEWDELNAQIDALRQQLHSA